MLALLTCNIAVALFRTMPTKRVDGAVPMENVQDVEIMGLRLSCVTEAQTNAVVLKSLQDERGGWICPVNLDVLRQVTGDDELRELVGSADLVVADGMPLLWASRIQGTPVPERVAGSSLISTLSGELARTGHSVYLLGGNQGTAHAAGVLLEQTIPGFSLAGWYCPPFGFESSRDELEQIEWRLMAAQPDVVFVGLGFPKQDRLISQLRLALPGAWFVSCGISLSFLIGEVSRAPDALQTLGLEWVHRLAQEPRRLAKRYLVQGLPFGARLFAASLRSRVTRRA
jgi:N-acetylglucosaminyldiphosphoundecaprenol N-acetyl-beta-D-mannosaminyltransferase